MSDPLRIPVPWAEEKRFLRDEAPYGIRNTLSNLAYIVVGVLLLQLGTASAEVMAGHQGDVVLVEAIDDGVVVGRHYATPEGGTE